MKKEFVILISIIFVLVLFAVWYLASPLFLDNVVDEDLPYDNDDVLIEDNLETMRIYEGNFVDADDFHQTSGSALVVETNGKKYLRFENFEATNGPDLKVYLSTDLSNEDYVSLGELKGNIGDQNYELTQEIDFEKYDTVLIWCEAFSVLFGSAELEQTN